MPQEYSDYSEDLVKQALADPEYVLFTTKGKNGFEVTIKVEIPRGIRVHVEQSYLKDMETDGHGYPIGIRNWAVNFNVRSD